MGFKLSGVDILYNKDGTVDYVFDDAKIDEFIAPFKNENNIARYGSKSLILSSSKDFESSDISNVINDRKE